MEGKRDERPVFTYQRGNTTIKIHSKLPFMTPEERSQWFEDNADLPEVKHLHKVLAESIWALEEQERRKQNENKR